jgi:hypothetical protein
MRDIRDLARAVIVLDERQQQHATPPSRRRATPSVRRHRVGPMASLR